MRQVPEPQSSEVVTLEEVTSPQLKGGLRVGWCQGNVTKGGLGPGDGGLEVGWLLLNPEDGGLGTASDKTYPPPLRPIMFVFR